MYRVDNNHKIHRISVSIHLANSFNMLKFLLGKKYKFDGSFAEGSQQLSVPQMLLIFMQMLLDGPGIVQGIKLTEPVVPSVAALTLSQLTMYNAVQNRTTNSLSIPRHVRDRESPAALYIAMKLYKWTRKKTVVDTVHGLGLCISYKRLLNISTDLANSLIDHYEKSGFVIPPQALFGVLSIFGMDNINHNPRSTTCTSSFNGTILSLIQFPTHDNMGVTADRETLNEEVMGKTSVAFLPTSYTNMEEIPTPKSDELHVPNLNCNSHLKPGAVSLKDTIKSGYTWLEHANDIVKRGELVDKEWLSWGAYHADKFGPPATPITPSMVLPLFRESAHSATTIHHCMKLIKDTTHYLNEGQTPIMVVDQPIYKLAKSIQFAHAETLGEDKFIVMMGAMHIEKMLYEMLGQWLDGTGWTTVLSNSGILSGMYV